MLSGGKLLYETLTGPRLLIYLYCKTYTMYHSILSVQSNSTFIYINSKNFIKTNLSANGILKYEYWERHIDLPTMKWDQVTVKIRISR